MKYNNCTIVTCTKTNVDACISLVRWDSRSHGTLLGSLRMMWSMLVQWSSWFQLISNVDFMCHMDRSTAWIDLQAIRLNMPVPECLLTLFLSFDAGPATVGPSRTGCGSPSSSEESTFLASEVVGSDPSSLKQSVVSPRGPLSNYEFENPDSIFSSLVEPPPAAFFSPSHVKSEPSGFPFCNDFNFLNCDFNSSGAPAGNSKAAAITGATKGSSSHRQAQNQHQHHHHQHMPVDMLNNPYNIDINTPLMPTPGGGLGFYSNPELSPTTARWYSQQAANFMDSSSCLAHGGHLAPPGSSGGNYMQNSPTPILRQRELVRYASAGGYCPSPEAGSTMVSLENIQAFMFSWYGIGLQNL